MDARLTISQIARRAGVSVRTLHYYDEIGLLRPAGVSEAGYRYYGSAQLTRLCRILLLRELDFPLKQIAALIDRPDATGALAAQRELLMLKRARLDSMIEAIDAMVKEGKEMDVNEFDSSEYRARRAEYAAEAEARWGDTREFNQFKQKTGGYSAAKWANVNAGLMEVLRGFAALRGGPAGAPEARAQIARWRDYISENFYECTPEMMRGLAEMYVADPRFMQTIDAAGAGTAEFIARAVAEYVKDIG